MNRWHSQMSKIPVGNAVGKLVKKESYPDYKEYTLEEVAKLNAGQSKCVMAIHGYVYDITNFLSDHPGGPEIVVNAAGRDASRDFDDTFHSDGAKKQLIDYEIGKLKDWVPAKAAAKAAAKPAVATQQKSSSNSLAIVIPLLIVAAAVAYQFLA